ncbi:MAG TPA: alpha/beta hydrolase [Campylobacterales bacterium]|nr:alpha/beta hydrolase [Campylobacterales bacterium]
MATREIKHNNQHFSLNYEILYHDRKEDIVILHGWGSNKEVMKQAFGKHFTNFRHIYIDMPGFGKSPNEHSLTTEDYASIMIALLKELSVSSSIIFGHSFGGKVATLMNPEVLVLLSSAGIIIPKPFKVRAKIKLFKLLKPLGLTSLRHLFASKDVQGMNQGMYETFKNVVDEDFSAHFKAFKNKAYLFWGKDDSATPLFAGEQMASLIENSHFYPLEGDHYFFLQQADFIETTLLKELHGTH